MTGTYGSLRSIEHLFMGIPYIIYTVGHSPILVIAIMNL